MASLHIEQDEEGLYVQADPEQAPEVRRALFQASIRFREEPLPGGGGVFRLDEGVARSTLYRALEAVP